MNLDRAKLLSIAKGAGVAAAGAVLAYFTQWAATGEAGVWGPVLTAALSVAVNALRKFADAPSTPSPESPEDEPDE